MTETMKGALWCALFLLIAGLTLGLLAGCGDSQVSLTGPTGPTGPPGPDDPIDPPPPDGPPRVDGPFSWHRYRGFSAFAAVKYDEQNTVRLYRQAMNNGFNTARVCAEARSWNRHGLPVVPMDIDALDSFLDTTAHIQGAQVLLMAICNLKEDGAPVSVIRAWTEDVSRLIRKREYKHVALSPGNELWHPKSSLRNNDALISDLVRILRRTGQPVTIDDNAHPAKMFYRQDWMLLSDIPNLHPWRSPDPTRSEIRKMKELAGGRLLISEPTCYQDGAIRGGCTSSKAQIRKYACNAKREGVLWTFHGFDGLIAQAPYGWFPDWSRVCD